MNNITIPEKQHNIEIHENLKSWNKKFVLRKIYQQFYELIKNEVDQSIEGKIVELGSGIGNLKSVISEAICTDVFENAWLDQVENAYVLSFKNASVSNLILFDVFHHLQYPGTAFEEFFRVLKSGGRIVIFEPYISFFGRIVYGVFHHEPIAWKDEITWIIPKNMTVDSLDYYAAQGNASRIFYNKKYTKLLKNWKVIKKKRIPASAYVLSGGYSKPQLFPSFLLSTFTVLDKFLGLFPRLFSTRVLVVLEKL
ncbi:MAG: methyltransferase domain-containing protein [Candidatus Magasanikbacteria bacterium]